MVRAGAGRLVAPVRRHFVSPTGLRELGGRRVKCGNCGHSGCCAVGAYGCIGIALQHLKNLERPAGGLPGARGKRRFLVECGIRATTVSESICYADAPANLESTRLGYLGEGHVQKLAIGIAGIAMLIGMPALAADMPVKAAVYKTPPPVTYGWTGFYVGGNVGGAWGDVSNNWNLLGADFFFPLPPSAPALLALTNQPSHPSSVIWGGQVGYNYQISSIVVGLEGDLNSLRLNSSFTSSLTGVPHFAAGAFATETAQSNYLATLRGRLGVVVEKWLLYGTVGLAVGHVTYTDFLNYNNLGATQFAQASETRIGWTLGGGAEYALTRDWSIKAEYLYVDLGKSSALSSLVPLGFGNVFDVSHEHRLTEQIGRVGINYKLDWGGPVTARY
jgi:outer membrane immunogenic protein